MQPNTSSQATNARLSAAFERHKGGDLAEAEREYREVLGQQPDHPTALHYLGLIAQQTGRPDTAVSFLQRSMQLDPARSRGLAVSASNRDATRKNDCSSPKSAADRTVMLLGARRGGALDARGRVPKNTRANDHDPQRFQQAFGHRTRPTSALDLEARVEFRIAPQKLAMALVELSRQADIPVVSDTRELNGFDSEGVSAVGVFMDRPQHPAEDASEPRHE